MNWFEGMETDMDFTRPKVYISETQIILENIASIISLSDTQITVSSEGILPVGKGYVRQREKIEHGHGQTKREHTRGRGRDVHVRYTSIFGENFFIKEISDGRILVEGKIQKVEFLQP